MVACGLQPPTATGSGKEGPSRQHASEGISLVIDIHLFCHVILPLYQVDL